MKKLLLVVILLLSTQFLSAQGWRNNVIVSNKTDQKPSFYDLQNAFYSYWDDFNLKSGRYAQNDTTFKTPPGWKQFKRWEWYWEPRINKQTGAFPETTSATEFEKYKKSYSQLKNANEDDYWTSVGPSSSGGGYAGIGRINCISFHPTDLNRIWVGSPSGGLWNTTDAGINWTVLTDNNIVLGVSDIAIPSDYEVSKTIYIATGDRDGGSSWTLGGGNKTDNHSIGILKSTDNGSTWINSGLNSDVSANEVMGFLRMHPTADSILYAGKGYRIYKSTNFANTWEEIHNSSNYVMDFEFNPENPDILYACTQDNRYGNVKIIKSVDGGINWSVTHQFRDTDSRIELAVTEANPSFVYALVSKLGGELSGIYKSTDSGNTFIEVFDGTISKNYLLGYYSDGRIDDGTLNNNNGIGWYALALAVSPTDENLLFLGGVNTWRSRDGGVSWDISSMWNNDPDFNFNSTVVVHADKHCLKFNNSTLYEGNDGGIYKSLDNGLSWTDLSDGITISQIYRLGVSASSENEVITGLQDNGSKLFESDNWIDVKGGDGMECLIDYSNANIQYASYQGGGIFRTNVKWNNDLGIRIDKNIGDGTLTGSWVTPYVINPINPKSIYVGYASVWKSTDYGSTFTKYSTVSSPIQKFRSMAIAPSDTMVMYIADHSNIWKTKDDGAQWNVVTGTLPVESNSITYIAIHSNDPNTVWVTIGGYGNEHVFETIDGGDSWTDISGGLPNLPVFCIVQNKQVTLSDHLYVGTDIGVFIREGKSDWQSYSSGLPNVMVTELEIYYNDANSEFSKIYASTYGRGLWASELVKGLDLEIDATLHSVINPLQKSYCGETIITPSIVIRNSGNETVTNLGISYIYGGSDPASFNWNGSLESGSFATISLPEIDLPFGEHTFTATIDEVNGGADDYNLNNMKSVNYSVIDEENVSLPMVEGFNNSFIPGCWTSEIITDEGSVGTPSLLFTANGDDPLIIPSEGSHMLKFNSKDCDNNDKIRLISPLFSSMEGDAITISFVWSEDSGGLKRNDSISVQWSTDRISWTNLASYTRYNIDNSGWMPKSVSFPLQEEQKTSLYIGFLFKSSNGNNCYLDDLSIAISEPLISIGAIIGSPFYVSNTKEASIEIPYIVNGQFNSNTFTAYLDSLGGYDDEIEIGFITSDGSGVILSAIPAKTPSSENYNVRIKSTDPIYVSSESNSFEIIYDSIAPELIISSVVGSSTSVSPINVKFTFTEEIVGFELSDIDVDNGIASNLQKINAQEYEADITPYAGGLVLVELKEDVIQDLAENLNKGVVQWSTEYIPGVGINELSQLGISVYPNPSSGIFTINFSKNGTHAKIRVINLIGEVLSTVELNNRNTYKFDISSLAKGVYILQIEVDQQIIDTQLIIQ